MVDRIDEKYGPCFAVLGIRKTRAKKAIAWMRNRGLLAWWREADLSLNTFETIHGKEWTYKALFDALDATRR